MCLLFGQVVFKSTYVDIHVQTSAGISDHVTVCADIMGSVGDGAVTDTHSCLTFLRFSEDELPVLACANVCV